MSPCEEILKKNPGKNVRSKRLQFVDVQGIIKNMIISVSRIKKSLDHGISYQRYINII